MDIARLVLLKERIALSGDFSPSERDFILTAVNALADAAERRVEKHNPPNYLGRIDALWAMLSIDEGGEGLCAAPIGGGMMPLIAADQRRVKQIITIARRMATMFRKPVRLVKFTAREDVEIYQP